MSMFKSIGIAMGLASIVALAGCNYNQSTAPVTGSKVDKGLGSISSATPPIDSIGIYHSVICDSVFSHVTYDTTKSFSWNLYNVGNNAHQFLKVRFNYDTTTIPTWVRDTLNALETVWFDTTVQTLFPDYLNVAKSKAMWDSVSTADKAFADSVGYYFANLSLGGYTWQQIATQIETKAASLLTLVNGTSFTGNTGGECAKGLVQVMGSSATLWQGKIGGTPNDDPRRASPVIAWIVAADAAGYLTGWTNACKKELQETGTLSIENQSKRIQAGCDGAIQASSLGILDLNTFK